MGETYREYAPSGAQIPSLNQVVPPSNPSTTAATPVAKSALEISLARQRPNAPDMINIARGNEVSTPRAQENPFSPDTSARSGEPAIE
ncbi:hypothetical protein [Mesorhizobium sp. B4-1-4]|uniref:hypothetical protein n=1 Tax=Mesorhizobium sp. B4-1-4 TaxID=2589888 RepID=UPI00112CE31C|nr:hypothetical protein [Mesorhizobium sp. B4-1-4]UCI32643.1 hypothetical protein FJW03_04115 [Mesorhizobium sp. B4-1-4]